MIRTLITTLALVIFIVTGPAGAAERVTPRGSHISLEPPAGYVQSSTFTGYMSPSGKVSIVLTEFPPEAFAQIRQGFSAEAMAQHGMRLLSVETIDGLPFEQTTVRAEQRSGGDLYDKWVMIFNGKTFTGMVSVSIFRSSPPLVADSVIRAALASVRISTKQSGDPIAALPFSVTPASRFHYRSTISGRGLLLKETPPPPEGQLDDVGFMVILAQEAAVETADQRQFGEQQFMITKAISDKAILSTKPLQVSGMNGFEYLAEGKQANGQKLRYLFVVLFPGGVPFLLLGSAPPERFDDALPDFRAIVASFRSKL
jgi:hypothetical protein